MKKKLLFALILSFMLVSCSPVDPGKGGDNPQTQETTPSPEVKALTDEAEEVLLSLVNETLENSKSKIIKESVKDFLEQEKTFIQGITELEVAENAISLLYEHEVEYTINVLIPLFHKALNDEIIAMINTIQDSNRRNSCFDNYYDFISRNEIGNAYDIIGVHSVYQSFYDMVKEHMGIEEEDPDLEELAEYIEAAERTIYWYSEEIASKLSYPDLANDIWVYESEETSRLINAKSVNEIYDLTEEIKEEILAFAHQISKGCAINDLTNTFEELESYFTKQEVLEIIATIKTHEMNLLNKNLDMGLELEDYQIVVENYQLEAVDFLWFSDIYKIYTEDLYQIKATYTEKAEARPYIDSIDSLYNECANKIRELDELDDYEKDVSTIIEYFETEVQKLLNGSTN